MASDRGSEQSDDPSLTDGGLHRAYSPISDTYARFQQAEKLKREAMIENNWLYFNPSNTIYEGNP